MALFDNLPDNVKKVLYAGIGAMAVGAEKSQDIFEDLARKGEETLEQGRTFNEEFSRKVREAADGATDEVLRSKFRGMSAEERAEWLERAKKISDDLEAEDADYDVVDEEEDIPQPTPGEPEDEPAE